MPINNINVNFVRRSIPLRGPFSTDDYNASMEEASVDFLNFANRWNLELYPVLSGLPAGVDETRWPTATSMPDPFSNGLDGDNLFVDNEAATSKDDGLLWDSTALRPLTVREFALYIEDRVSTLQTDLESVVLATGNGLTVTQWSRLGMWVKDGTASLTTSVDGKASEAKTKVNQLILDVFNSASDLGSLSTSGFTVQEMVDALCALHGGTWNTDPSGMTHDSLEELAQGAVRASGSYIKRQRGYSPDASNLQEDMNRLRYEIARIKWGAATTETTGQWNTDATDPVGGVGCLNLHMSYQGSGTVSDKNPHGLHYGNVTGLSAELGYLNAFTGKTAVGSELPTYSSEVYIVSGDSLETAIGKIDAALNAHVTTATVREVYDFSGHTDISAPIVITHNKGTAGIENAGWPHVQVIDTGVGGDYGVLIDENYVYEQEHGIVTTDAFVSIEFINTNVFHVYTNVVQGKIVAVF